MRPTHPVGGIARGGGMALKAPRIILFRDSSGAWRFHRQARNGRITSPSQGYKRKGSALKEIDREFPGLAIVERG